MSAPKRIIQIAFPGKDGDPVFDDYVRADIADGLLEALEIIVMERAWYREERPDGYNIEERLNAWEETARAAIAKARGE